MIILSIKFTKGALSHSDEHKTALELRDKLLRKYVPNTHDFRFATYDGGKPYIENSPISYSVSHTVGCIICAMSIPDASDFEQIPSLTYSCNNEGDYLISASGVPCEIGADVELVTEERSVQHLTLLAERYFRENDIKHFHSSKNKLRQFFSLWTKYESIAKCSGDGLAAIVAGHGISDFWCKRTVITRRILHDNGEYLLSVCFAEK